MSNVFKRRIEKNTGVRGQTSARQSVGVRYYLAAPAGEVGPAPKAAKKVTPTRGRVNPPPPPASRRFRKPAGSWTHQPVVLPSDLRDFAAQMGVWNEQLPQTLKWPDACIITTSKGFEPKTGRSKALWPTPQLMENSH